MIVKRGGNYKKKLNGHKKLITLIFITIALPLTIFLALSRQNLLSSAASASCVSNVDPNNGVPSTGFVGLVMIPQLAQPPQPAPKYVKADIRLRGGRGSVWVMLSGTGGSLSVAQMAILDRGAGPRFVAIYGNGNPGEAGSSYTECDLGPADRKLHSLRVNRGNGKFRFNIDGGAAKLIIPDNLSWPTTRASAMAEVHNNPMPTVRVANVETNLPRVKNDWNNQVVGTDGKAAVDSGRVRWDHLIEGAEGLNTYDGFWIDWPRE